MPKSQGQLLEIDLAAARITRREASEEMLHAYLGGSGLAARMLYEELDPRVDPLVREALSSAGKRL